MMKKIALALALALALSPVACSPEAGDPEAEAPENTLMHDTLPDQARPAVGQEPADTAGVVSVVLEEWTIRLATDTIPARAGTTTFRARNNGEYAHILEVEGQGREWVTDTIPPGEWRMLETRLEPGTYELYCPIEGEHGDHSAMGMTTYIVVR